MGSKDVNKERYDNILRYKDEIEKTLSELSWERLDDRNASRIAVYKEYTNETDMVNWALEKLKSFRDCFKGYISQACNTK